MDVLIVSTNSPQQAQFWQRRLDATVGQIAKTGTLITTVHEDWPGGAGNGLGTLYAYQQARRQILLAHGVDITTLQQQGASIALYHTAGKGTRLAPLPGSEYNNKAAVKLPAYIDVNGAETPITILEAVIRQTEAYAPSRKGRLSVFWGDQIFIPSVAFDYEAKHHIDILASMRPLPTAAEWEEQGLHKYGLIAVDALGEARQVEKVSYTDAMLFAHQKALSFDGGFGTSLGGFSLSCEMTAALMEEFSADLDERTQSLGSDFHFWMPMTLDWETYEAVQGGGEVAAVHYQRMQAFKTRFQDGLPNTPFFGAVDIGAAAYWWDYGIVRHYIDNNLKLLAHDDEAACMRAFFGFPHPSEVACGDGSGMLRSVIGKGRVRNSLLIGVHTDEIDVEDSVIIHSVAPSIHASHSLLYNVVEAGPLYARSGTVRADVFMCDPKRHFKLYSSTTRDGSLDWNERMPRNPMTFADLYKLNTSVDLNRSNRYSVRARSKVITKPPI